MNCPHCEGGYIIAPAYPVKARVILCGNCGIEKGEEWNDANIVIQKKIYLNAKLNECIERN